MKNILLFLLAVLFFPSETFAQCGNGIYFYKSTDFEADSNLSVLIDTADMVNPWQIAQPQKTILDAALSPTKALVTDSVNLLQPNDTSYATIVIPLVNWLWTYLHFRHKYDIDSLHQKAWMECSYDLGENWLLMDNIGFSSACDAALKYWYECVPDTFDYVEGPYFTGTTTEWKHSGYYWVWWLPERLDKIQDCTIPPDTLLVRFVFVNDSVQTNHDGWMIDNLEVFDVEPVGAVETTNKHHLEIFPNPARNQIRCVADNIVGVNVKSILGESMVVTTSESFQDIDVLALPFGTYILTATLSDGSVSRKMFVKQ